MSAALYQGRRLGPSTADAVIVVADGQRLPAGPSQRLSNHSPDGFNWGYGGSGPAQLALALLLDHTGNPKRALAHYQGVQVRVRRGLGRALGDHRRADRMPGWPSRRCARERRHGYMYQLRRARRRATLVVRRVCRAAVRGVLQRLPRQLRADQPQGDPTELDESARGGWDAIEGDD
jgi:hypothetical protein